MALVVKNLPANAGEAGSEGLIPGSEKSPGGEYDNPLQYSCLENPMSSRRETNRYQNVKERLSIGMKSGRLF